MINSQPVKEFDDIVNTLIKSQSKNRITAFWDKVMVYLRQKYPAISDRKRISQFKIDYYDAYLKDASDGEKDVSRKKGRLNRMIRRWIKEDIDYIKREMVIATAFALIYKPNQRNSIDFTEDGETIANHLLFAIGYPKLSHSSETEAFYIYALTHGMTYMECIDLYNSYLGYIKGRKHVDLIGEQSESTTYFVTYFDFQNISQQEFYEKLWDRSWDLRNGSKFMTDYFVKSFSLKAKESGVIQTTALFFLMFATKADNGNIYEKLLSDYDQYCRNDKVIRSVDTLSEWLNDQHCYHKVIKRNTFDSFYSAIDTLKSQNGIDKYISREGFIMWMLFCGDNYEEINVKLKHRFGTLQQQTFFDKFATIVTDISLSDNRVLYYDRASGTTYIVMDTEHILQTTNESCLRASVVNALLDNLPEEFMLNSIFATNQSISPAINTITT